MISDESFSMYSIDFLIIILPLLGVILSSIFSNKIFAKFTTTILVLLSSILSWYLFSDVRQSYIINLFPWIKIYKLQIFWAIYVDSLTKLMFVVVTTVSSVVHIYSIGYMVHDSGVRRFFIYLSLFTFFMLVLVSSSNFLQLFFGWEGVGVCSYLLIGFWYEKFSACRSAIKAFIVNRIGDFFFLIGMILLFWTFGSLDFDVIFDFSNFSASSSVVDLACILLFLGCMGKSAQIGLHSWLPDAMEGPTPASALIHAATMVTAGVFLMARCSPLFEMSDYSKSIVVVVGTLTCFFAATVALFQSDIKKIIAYSTCSQLGYMFIACGVSSYNYAIFHLMTHAFFKALLFLCAGNIIHSFSGEQNIFKMGRCYKKLPYTYSLTLIASLALAGIFPFSGFYSKDLIIEGLYHYSSLFYFLANLVAFLTAFYSWRLIILVFHSSKTTEKPVHESSSIMLLPLLVLAIGSIFAGLWGENFLHITDKSFWNKSIVVIEDHNEISFIRKLLPLFVSLLGIIAAYLRYCRNFCSSIRENYLFTFLRKKWYFDEVYHYCLVLPFCYLSRTFAFFIDNKIIDSLGPVCVAKSVVKFAKNTVKLQTGMIFDYAFIMFVGIIALLVSVICFSLYIVSF